MELLVAAVVGGVLLALGLFAVILKVVDGAVDHLLDWLVYNFGNERASQRVQEKWRQRDTEATAD